MSRKNKAQKPQANKASSDIIETPNGSVEFSIAAPEPVMGKSLLDMLGTFLDPWGKYYQPPICMKMLSRLRHANAHHGAAIGFKRNKLAQFFVETNVISLADFRAAALDFMVFGNAYFKIFTDYFGTITRMVHVPALNIRKMKDTEDGQSQYLQLCKNGEQIEFAPGEILHIMDYDTGQQFYGVPEWLCAMQSILLNEDSTLFRRRYFANGCHIGYILYTTDPAIDPKTENSLKEKIKEGKGVGNFKSVYINIPNGKDKGVQVIPVGDISQKDEFERIKNISADDVIVGHRMHPALAALKPENAGGFGDIEKIDVVYTRNEVRAMAMAFQEVNSRLPAHARFTFEFPV